MATRSMEVDVRSRGVTNLAKELRDVASAAREVQKETAGLGRVQVGGGAAASVRTSGQAAATEARRQEREAARQAREAAREQARQERFGPGPRQDLLRIQADRERAQALAESPQRTAILGDLGDREARARRRVILNERLKASGPEGLQAPGLLESFQKLNALMGSIKGGNVLGTLQHLGAGVQLLRGAPGGVNLQAPFGGGAAAGAGAAEAVGAAGTALEGLGAAAAEVAPPVAAATAALVAVALGVRQFVQELSQVAESLNQLNRAQVQSGGTRAETLQLVARGIPAGAISGMAASLRERLSTDPLAIAAGARVGVGFQMPRPFGQVNEARTLLDVLDGLRKVTDAEERLRLARMLQIDADTQYLLVSQKVADSMKADAALRESLVTPESSRAAIDFQAELDRVGQAMQLLKDVGLSQALSGMADNLGEFADAINATSGALRQSHLPELLGDTAKRPGLAIAGGLLLGPMGAVIGALVTSTATKLLGLDRGKGGAADTATAAHTRAMQDHTRALVENSAYLLMHGFSTPGQDARMRRVFPEGAFSNPLAMREAFQSQGLGAGGYRL